MWRTLLALLIILSALQARPAAADVPYRTEISGIEDRDLARDLRNASQLVELESRPPASEAALTRRAESDRDRLDAVLRAAGYYDATITFDVDTRAQPALVRIAIDPGHRYTLASVEFVAPDGGKPALIGRYAPLAFGLEIGGPARSRPILDAEPRIVRTLAEHGYPLAKVADRRVVVDKATKTMEVTYTVDTGGTAKFGATAISGTRDVEPDYVRRRITWRMDDLYDIRAVEQTRKDLVASGLFATVRVAPATSIDSDGRIAMMIDVTERPHRSVGVGLNYDTTLGASARAFWEHRNLWGNAERLRITGEAGERRQGFDGAFRRPDLFLVNQDLLANLTAESESLEAYDRRRLLAFTGLEQKLGDGITAGGGIQIERTHLEEPARILDYTLLGAPLFVRRDVTDSLLDPTRGSRQALTVTPYVSPAGQDFRFVSSRLQGSVYYAIDEQADYILAGFAAIGSVAGESRDELPKDKRLYAGGGGSIRGYGFQKAGPLDSSGDPIGGRSSLELSIELRAKITDTIGLVPFLEGGNVYESTLPRFDEKLLFGAGLGVRYYTPIGPVRFDVAFPLDRRPEDRAFQVYISIGQAF